MSFFLYLFLSPLFVFFFFFNDTATTEIYTLSLHDALPISLLVSTDAALAAVDIERGQVMWEKPERSEEHTSELQSPCNLVCRLLLEKKKKKKIQNERGREIDASRHTRSAERTSGNGTVWYL